MSYQSMQVQVSDGTLQEVLFSIPFLSTEHLHFYLGTEEVTASTAALGITVASVSFTKVVLSGPVPNGVQFRVLRKTPRLAVPHVFATGAALFSADTTDANNKYMLYIVQETYEQSGEGPFPTTDVPLTGDEIVYVLQGGVRKQTTVGDMIASSGDVGLLVGMDTFDAADYFLNSI